HCRTRSPPSPRLTWPRSGRTTDDRSRSHTSPRVGHPERASRGAAALRVSQDGSNALNDHLRSCAPRAASRSLDVRTSMAGGATRLQARGLVNRITREYRGQYSFSRYGPSASEVEGLPGDPGRLVEVGGSMSKRDEGGFELRGGEEDAAVEHGVEESAVARGVRLLGGCVVRHQRAGEEGGEHGADAIDGERDTRRAGAIFQARLELRATPLEPRIHLGRAESAERGETGCDGERVAGEGARLIDPARRGDALHEAAGPAVGAHGETAADDLPEAGEVGSDAVERLGPAVRDTKARDDLVEDQERAVPVAEGAQPREETGCGRHHA